MDASLKLPDGETLIISKMNNRAPVALFAYNRLRHFTETVQALAANDLSSETDLYIFCDGPKGGAVDESVTAVRLYARSLRCFRSVSIVEREENLGLAKSIIAGVTQVCAERGRVIVVEDDIVTSPYFLKYMNDALDLYQDNHEVVSVHGYVYPLKLSVEETFLMKGADCWGWATWERGWREFNPDGGDLLRELKARGLSDEFDFGGRAKYTRMLEDQIAGKNDSWAIRWHASAFLKGKLTLYPGTSLVRNIGFDGSGQHCGVSDRYESPLSVGPITVCRLEAHESPRGRVAFELYFESLRKTGRVNKFFKWIRKVLRVSKH